MALRRQEHDGKISGVGRRNVLAGNALGFRADLLHQGLAGRIDGSSITGLACLLQTGVVLHGEFAVDGQIHRIRIFAGQADGKFDPLQTAGNDGDVLRVLFRCQHGGKQIAQLHFAPDAAGLDVG